MELLNNPQELVSCYQETIEKPAEKTLSAIFIPFTVNVNRINSLLSELSWFKEPIFLMPSTHSDILEVSLEGKENVTSLFLTDSKFLLAINALNTSKVYHNTYKGIQWDLYLKRNYAIWFSLERRFSRILLMDDDIRGISPTIVEKGVRALNHYSTAGCFVEQFPDTSVIGHIELSLKDDFKCFLSGSFLFIKPTDVDGFFPYIYNEDWIFMIPYILNKTICSFGSIRQLEYNPYFKKNIRFQEFGEVIAEGLYSLIGSKLFSYRFEQKTWEEIILLRKRELQTIKKKLRNPILRDLLNHAIEINDKISAKECLAFIKNWEKDISVWNNKIKGIVDGKTISIKN